MKRTRFRAWLDRHSADEATPHRSPHFPGEDYYEGFVEDHYVDTRKAQPLHTVYRPPQQRNAPMAVLETYYRGQDGQYGRYHRLVELDGLPITEQLLRTNPAATWVGFLFGAGSYATFILGAASSATYLLGGFMAGLVILAGFLAPLVQRSASKGVHSRTFTLYEDRDELESGLGRDLELRDILGAETIQEEDVFHDPEASKQERGLTDKKAPSLPGEG